MSEPDLAANGDSFPTAFTHPGGCPSRRRFAKISALTSLGVGAASQIAYHLMTARHVSTAPWPVTTLVATLPVAVLGMGAALAHLITRTTPPGAHPRPTTGVEPQRT